jgi:hypothetical protein
VEAFFNWCIQLVDSDPTDENTLPIPGDDGDVSLTNPTDTNRKPQTLIFILLPLLLWLTRLTYKKV